MSLIFRVWQKLVSMVRAPDPQHRESNTPLVVSHVFANFYILFYRIYTKLISAARKLGATCLMNFVLEIVFICLI